MATVSLPQFAKDASARAKRVSARRSQFKWDHSFLPGTGLLAGLPVDEAVSPPVQYAVERADEFAAIKANKYAVARKYPGPITSLRSYEDQFERIPKPTDTIANFTTDEWFAEQRLSGPNPMMLSRVDDQLALRSFPVDDSILASATQSSQNILEAIAAGQIFMADYGVIDGVTTTSNTQGPRYLHAAKAMYWASPAKSRGVTELIPVAIQLGQTPASSPIFKPRDPLWHLAKTHVQIADGNVHEVGVHLWATHFVAEIIATAMFRCLDVSHPLSELLRRHIDNLLANNFAAKHYLIPRVIDKLFPGGARGALALLAKYRDSYDWSRANPVADFNSRGVNGLQHYPYRDDALAVWAAVVQYVNEYVEVYYRNDGDVTNDYELQAMVGEIAGKQADPCFGGNLKGFPPTIGTRTLLAETVARIVFTCGPQHAAVNYPQYTSFTYAPNVPSSGYGSPLPPPLGDMSSQLLPLLPNAEHTADQVEIVAQLSWFRYDSLGYYRDRATGYSRRFFDDRAEKVATKFRAALVAVGDIVQRADRDRKYKYRYLLPDNIPNSTSI